MIELQINSQHHSLKAKGFHHVHTDMLTQRLDILTTPQTITNLDGNDYVLPPILEQIGDLKVKQMDHSGGGASTTGGSAPLSFAALDWETSLINAIEYAYGHNMCMKTVGEAVGYAIRNYPQESVVEWFEKQLDHLTQQAWTIIYPQSSKSSAHAHNVARTPSKSGMSSQPPYRFMKFLPGVDTVKQCGGVQKSLTLPATLEL